MHTLTNTNIHLHATPRALAALFKELHKSSLQGLAIELFDWLRGLPQGHDYVALLDVYTYTTMIVSASLLGLCRPPRLRSRQACRHWGLGRLLRLRSRRHCLWGFAGFSGRGWGPLQREPSARRGNPHLPRGQPSGPSG